MSLLLYDRATAGGATLLAERIADMRRNLPTATLLEVRLIEQYTDEDAPP